MMEVECQMEDLKNKLMHLRLELDVLQSDQDTQKPENVNDGK